MDDAIRIAAETGLAYTGLRDFQVDARLWHYVPPSLAHREQIVPVVLAGDTLKLATADPETDISALRANLPNLTIDLVIARAEEIAAVLADAPSS